MYNTPYDGAFFPLPFSFVCGVLPRRGIKSWQACAAPSSYCKTPGLGFHRYQQQVSSSPKNNLWPVSKHREETRGPG